MREPKPRRSEVAGTGHTGGARIAGQLPSGLHIPHSEACTRETPKQNTGPGGDSFRSVTPRKSKPEIKAVDTSQLSSPKPAVGCSPAGKGGRRKARPKRAPPQQGLAPQPAGQEGLLSCTRVVTSW